VDRTEGVDRVEHALEQQAHHLAGAIYGTILATTVVAATSNHPEPLGRTVVLVLGTSIVFWLAHFYAHGLAARVIAQRPLRRAEILSIARSEWPMLQSSWPIVLTLLLGVADIIDPARAVNAALLVGVGALCTYGFLIGRREHLGWPHVLLNTAAAGGFGLAILVLKVSVH
jgi:hypothetical protein